MSWCYNKTTHSPLSFSAKYSSFFEITIIHIMKPILTKAELHFLLDKHELSDLQLRQIERLETCRSVLRALQLLYPEKLQGYVALFLFFSIINPLEHKLITPFHPQLVLLAITIVTNCIGLIILKYNSSEWINTCLEDLKIGLLPPVSAYRSGIIAVTGMLFLLPGIVFSVVGTILLIPPITTLLAIYLQKRILLKFE